MASRGKYVFLDERHLRKHARTWHVSSRSDGKFLVASFELPDNAAQEPTYHLLLRRTFARAYETVMIHRAAGAIVLTLLDRDIEHDYQSAWPPVDGALAQHDTVSVPLKHRPEVSEDSMGSDFMLTLSASPSVLFVNERDIKDMERDHVSRLSNRMSELFWFSWSTLSIISLLLYLWSKL